MSWFWYRDIIDNLSLEDDSFANTGSPRISGSSSKPPTVSKGKSWADADDCDEEEEEEEEEEKVLSEKALAWRRKQIEMGKSTIGYKNYRKAVPKKRRIMTMPDVYPITPNIYKNISKRSWAGLACEWRRRLHNWDVIPGDDPHKWAVERTMARLARDKRVKRMKKKREAYRQMEEETNEEEEEEL